MSGKKVIVVIGRNFPHKADKKLFFFFPQLPKDKCLYMSFQLKSEISEYFSSPTCFITLFHFVEESANKLKQKL